jgi:hypothetical protein
MWSPGGLPAPAAGIHGRRQPDLVGGDGTTNRVRGLEGGGLIEDGAVGSWRCGAPLASAVPTGGRRRLGLAGRRRCSGAEGGARKGSGRGGGDVALAEAVHGYGGPGSGGRALPCADRCSGGEKKGAMSTSVGF